FPGVVDGDDGGVVERGGGLGLAAEPCLEGRVAGEVGPQDLDRDGAAQPGVVPDVDLSHAATADELTDLVPVSENPRCLRHYASLGVVGSTAVGRRSMMCIFPSSDPGKGEPDTVRDAPPRYSCAFAPSSSPDPRFRIAATIITSKMPASTRDGHEKRPRRSPVEVERPGAGSARAADAGRRTVVACRRVAGGIEGGGGLGTGGSHAGSHAGPDVGGRGTGGGGTEGCAVGRGPD